MISRTLTKLQVFGRALSVQGSVIHALILRDLHTRFGRENIGYVWLIAEPLMLATVISVIHSFIGGEHGGDMHPGVFTLLGYCVFIIFRGVFNRAAGILEGNMPLMYHRMVTFIDIMLVRTIIETAGCFCAYVILLAVFITVGIGNLPYRPLYLLAAFGLMMWWSFATSLMVAAWTFDSRTAERLVHPIAYFAIPLSGAFVTLKFLPDNFRAIMEWNPMVYMFEIGRYGQFESADPDFAGPAAFGYVLGWNMFLTYVGLLALRRVRQHVHLS